MKIRGTEFIVGLFALAGLSMIIFMSTQVNRNHSIHGSSHNYHADFDSVSGLIPKIPVEVSGIISGYVDTIDLVNNKARITVKIDGKVRVHKDAALLIRDRGALGDRYVMLNPGSEDQPLLEDGGQIAYTQSQSDFEKLAKTLTETADMLKEVVGSDNPKGALGKAIQNLRDLTGHLNDVITANSNNIAAITENIKNLSAQLNSMTAENRDHIRELVTSLNQVVDKVNSGKGTLGKLINDDTTVNHLNEALDGFNQTLGLFNRVQLKFRYRGEYLAGSHDMQNIFGIIVAPGPDKYILVELNSSPVGATDVTNTTITSGGTTTTTQTVQTDIGITYSIMFAKQFWDTTLRVGLIRSKGGVALDYHMLKDHLIFTGEVFDLNRPNNRPQVRLYATLYFYRHFILTGGVDDAMTQVGAHNPFVGLGIQFTDNDFKAILPALKGSSF